MKVWELGVCQKSKPLWQHSSFLISENAPNMDLNVQEINPAHSFMVKVFRIAKGTKEKLHFFAFTLKILSLNAVL